MQRCLYQTVITVPFSILYRVTDIWNERTSTIFLEVFSCMSGLCFLSTMSLGIYTHRERIVSEATTHPRAPFPGLWTHLCPSVQLMIPTFDTIVYHF
ncbi:hypothetical protein SCLCIDRAFT_1218874 [Scleroderma citrinum Foug A]|uniref:Uncharacterized protein n=1 Tax=Scleroderma citrinum Foug A TaxID=1036808 RepID=A0A0C3DBQ4_9AGAM|nr:hypothetical protein SCLCIDRAFT_1218874 [Scleroderma citrinum Foug A]